ncbi:sulfur relay protein TusE [Achromatium sp. WMS2]|nr:sulfur relay protein TusE [Achromatium sp. WMS2]
MTLGPNGFMTKFDDWDEDVAKILARQEGVELLAYHWTTMRFVRDYFRRFEIPPSPKVIIREIGKELHTHRCTHKTLRKLFPDGGCRQACRLAGLPDYYCYIC